MKRKEIAMILVLALLLGSVSGVAIRSEAQTVQTARGSGLAKKSAGIMPANVQGNEKNSGTAAPSGTASAEPSNMPSANPPAATATISATTVPVTAPVTPLVTGIRGGSKRVKLYWNKVSNADGYYIYYSTSKNGSYSKLKTITSGATVKYVKKSLLQNQTYYFKISAYRKNGTGQVESPLSVVYSATTGKVSATSTAGKTYSSKAKFKKSNSYKKFSVLKNANYTRTFAIPGMKNTNVAGFASSKMIPQAACLAGGYLLVSAYDKSGDDESVIYVINKATKAYITTIVMPNKTKLNAMVYDGKNIWVTQKKYVSYFPYEVITQAIGSGNQYYELTSFTDTLPILTTGSYMTYYNNILWVGAYHATATTNAYGYSLTKDSNGKIALQQTYYMAIPNRTRAISFDADGYLYITRSSKQVSSAAGYMSQVRSFKPSLSSPTKTGGIKKNALLKKTKLPEMAMGSAVYGTYLYHVFASCQYKKCTYKVDRVVAVKLTKLQ